MALYMFQAAYTAESVAAQIKQPQNRIEAVRPSAEAVGGKIIAGGYSFGEYDVVILAEAPDDVTAASISLATVAGGAVRLAKTTRLLSGQEWSRPGRRRRVLNTSRPVALASSHPGHSNSSLRQGGHRRAAAHFAWPEMEVAHESRRV